jgi:alcohol dehydrogenase
MKETWVYYNPVRFHFGSGCRRFLLEELQNKRCLIVVSQRGRRQMWDDPILTTLVRRPENRWVDTVKSNPDINDLQAEIDQLRGSHFDAVIGFGGGSALDSAKAFAVMLSTQMEGVALAQAVINPELFAGLDSLPMYAVPTTAGTGSEVTPFATIWDHDNHTKLSLAGTEVFPHTAIVDPELTYSLPQEMTLYTGLDAINQAAESIWNKNATPITIGNATRALRLGLDALPKLVESRGDSWSERAQMAECSLLAGLAISQTRTALCHSISYPISAHFGVPHGLACAFTMPAVLALNLECDDGRFRELEKNLGLSSILHAVEALSARLGVIQRLKDYVHNFEDLEALTREMYTPNRADNNLAPVESHTIEEVLRAAW